MFYSREIYNLIELRTNIEKNGLENVEVRPFAVGSHSGVVAFARGINGGVRGGGNQTAIDDVQVPIVTLDEALAGRVDLIKIDVEGYEEEVLVGAKEIIKHFGPNLFVEIHPKLMTGNRTAEGVFDFLKQFYSRIELYQPVRTQSVFGKLLSRYARIGSIERLSSVESVLESCRQYRQETFWAVCRSHRQQ